MNATKHGAKEGGGMMNEYMIQGGSLPYEYAIKQKVTQKTYTVRVLFCVFYGLWVLGNLLLAIFFKGLIPFVIIAGPAILWLFVFLTWRRTFVEYEFSFFGGELTVCRILKGKSRKVLAEISLRELSAVILYDDAHAGMIRAFGAMTRTVAISSPDAPEIYALLWKDENDVKHLLAAELNDRALKEIKRYNVSAMRK